MLEPPPTWLCAWLLALTAIAAALDARTGSIPNWLTLPTLIAAPLAHAATDGTPALGTACASAALCAAAPLLLFCARAIGGGDVKLFAALGALCGLRLGLEVELLSCALALVCACAVLSWHGRLSAVLRNTYGIAIAHWTRRAPPAPHAMTSVRLGPSILVASALSLVRAALEAAP